MVGVGVDRKEWGRGSWVLKMGVVGAKSGCKDWGSRRESKNDA
jgi:hypothetical protein